MSKYNSIDGREGSKVKIRHSTAKISKDGVYAEKDGEKYVFVWRGKKPRSIEGIRAVQTESSDVEERNGGIDVTYDLHAGFLLLQEQSNTKDRLWNPLSERAYKKYNATLESKGL